MNRRSSTRTGIAWLAAAFLCLPAQISKGESGRVALEGVVTSQAEGAMEGVLVTAQADASPVAVTVVSDAQGRYAFPAERLPPARYRLSIRAIGYELAGPLVAQVDGETAAHRDVALSSTKNLAAQMTSSEWLTSMPGSDEDKRPLIECMSCHTLERVVTSHYTSDEFVDVLRRMANYANNTTQAHIQLRVEQRDPPEARLRKLADYLASINQSTGPRAWPLKTFARPKGRATRVVITEYALPRATIAPHDVRVDRNGDVWYSDFTENVLGRFDPRTGDLSEFAYPLFKQAPTGSLDLEPDAGGDLWLALMFQGGLAKFDTRSKTFRFYPVPSALDDKAMQQSMVMPWRADVDGKVWTNDVARQTIMRVDLATGTYERIDPFASSPKGSHAPYGMAADAQNNLWFMDFGGEAIGKIDAKTLRPTLYPTPTPLSRPRRVMLDGDELWFAEFAANKLAKFDIKTERFTEWPAPTPHSYPYDAFLDRAGDLWSGNMSNDRVLRMRPDTGEAIEYLLPRKTNIRRVFVDNSTPRPTVWAGDNHGAAIVKLEPLD